MGGVGEPDEGNCALIQRLLGFGDGLEEIIGFSAALIENIEETFNK